MAETEFGRELAIVRPQLFREESYALLSRFEGTLSAIYAHYFGGEGELGTFRRMSRELAFTPQVASKPVAQIVFGWLVQRNSTVAFRAEGRREGGTGFDLGCFMDYLIVLAHLAARAEGEEGGDQEKLYRLLQRMQVSAGYQKLSKLTRLEHFFQPLEELQREMLAGSRKQARREGSPLRASRQQQRLVETPLRKQLGEYYEPLKGRFVELCGKRRA